ncbi:MAG: AlpA family phage regulatory protein [Pseudomonadota bacterium]|nr:AlpA family phage regulatory protein [Pseudomonadota bacterium]
MNDKSPLLPPDGGADPIPAIPLCIANSSADACSPKMSTEGPSDVASSGDAAHRRKRQRSRKKPLRSSEEPKSVPRVMRLRDVLRETGLGRSTVYRMVAEHTFPAPVKLSRRAIGFFRSDVEQWFANRSSTSGR